MNGGAPPRLTVLLVTYNHERYVRQAVDSILMQKLDEEFQVIVADDGSSDRTREIIAEAFARHRSGAPAPRFLDFSVNRGITENYRRSFQACATEYVAILEGDDYWISPKKLALQLDFLEFHRECSAVSANYFTYDETIQRYAAKSAINADFGYLDARSLIGNNVIGNFSTCMYRTEALKNIPEAIYVRVVYDWGINICVGRDALIGFLHTPLSVYRIHEKGSWSGQSLDARVNAQVSVIDHYNKSLDFIFDDEFEALKRSLAQTLAPGRVYRPIVPRMLAVLYACIPPFAVTLTRWAVRSVRRHLMPPIVPIVIRKFRNDRRGRS